MRLSKGFTLAEVLITLGIVGVVAAISLPTLQSNVQKQKVGPSLRKFMNTMENANLRLMEDADVDMITDATTSPSTYANLLTKYISATATNSGSSINKFDGSAGSYETNATLTMTSGESVAVSPIGSGALSSVVATLYYDLNGATNAPNRLGKDIFAFRLTNKGTVIPAGGKQEFAITGLPYLSLANRWATKLDLVAEIDALPRELKKIDDDNSYFIEHEKSLGGKTVKVSDANIAGNAANAVDLSSAVKSTTAVKSVDLEALENIDLSKLDRQKWTEVDLDSINTLQKWVLDDSLVDKFEPIKNLGEAKFTLVGSSNICNSTNVTTGFGCAGSVADNNWKVIYKY